MYVIKNKQSHRKAKSSLPKNNYKQKEKQNQVILTSKQANELNHQEFKS
jgi:hypothetical protein